MYAVVPLLGGLTNNVNQETRTFRYTLTAESGKSLFTQNTGSVCQTTHLFLLPVLDMVWQLLLCKVYLNLGEFPTLD